MATIANLTVEIKGTDYGVETFLSAETGNRVVRLTKESSGDRPNEVHDVVQGPSRTTCTCKDFQYRHAGLDFTQGCKHVQSLVGFGLVENVSPYTAQVEEAAPVAETVETVETVEDATVETLAAKPARYLVSATRYYGDGNESPEFTDRPMSLEALSGMVGWGWSWTGTAFEIDDQAEQGDDWNAEGRYYTACVEIRRADGKRISKRHQTRINEFLDVTSLAPPAKAAKPAEVIHEAETYAAATAPSLGSRVQQAFRRAKAFLAGLWPRKATPAILPAATLNPPAPDAGELLDRRRALHAELVAMPAHKQGSDWHRDRVRDMDWINRTLRRQGVIPEHAAVSERPIPV